MVSEEEEEVVEEGVAGVEEEEVWNANLFYSAWLSLYGAAYLLINCPIAYTTKTSPSSSPAAKRKKKPWWYMTIFSSLCTSATLLAVRRHRAPNSERRHIGIGHVRVRSGTQGRERLPRVVGDVYRERAVLEAMLSRFPRAEINDARRITTLVRRRSARARLPRVDEWRKARRTAATRRIVGR